MSYALAQARYDAMTDEHPDDDLYDLDPNQLYDALQFMDCDGLKGRKYHECERRRRIIEQLIEGWETT